METQNDSSLSDFVDLLAKPKALAADLLWTRTNGQTIDRVHHPVLWETTKQLFRRVEHLTKLYNSQVQGGGDNRALSGLEELYTGGNDDDQVDTETLWGQVDLQNEALHTLLKSSIRKLSKATRRRGTPKEIRLLVDMDDGSEDNAVDPYPAEGPLDGEEKDGSSDDGDEDEERIRIRERMERTMADMDEEEEEEMAESSAGAHTDPEDENIVDPARDKLRDGFFDLHEMEAFADEEEEYLPDSAYPEENPEDADDEKDKRSFHQKLRDGGEIDGGSDDDEDEQNDLLFRKVPLVRRKKYRADEEIDALEGIYGESKEDEDDDDIINMTAGDIFGKPDKKITDRWNAKTKQKNTKKTDDEDSWNDYAFGDNADEEEDEATGWNDNNQDDGSVDDEHIPMKDMDTVQALKPVSGKKSKLDAQIEELEKEMLAEKPWQMKGESVSTARPVNSLLEATPEFEVATKMAPIITVAHTKSLEDVIKDRVLSETFDDVIPRELPDVGWHARRGELPEVSQEKSKLGLGELYEREYLKRAVGYDVDAAEKESEEEKAKSEMKTLFANLCSKLDALSNYHFAPRPIEVEAEVRAVTKPAIAMEEVLPLHVSDARGVAPEEVYGAKRGREGILRTDAELDQQERKRLRGSKKAARRKDRKQTLADEKLISRLQPGMGLNNPYEKRKMREELSVGRALGKVSTGKADTNEYGSSGTFFKRMQEEAQQSIAGNKHSQSTEGESKRKSSNSSSFKL